MFTSRWSARLVVCCLCLLTFFFGYDISPLQLGEPVDLQGDVFQCCRLMKSVTEPGGEYRCAHLGAPFVAEHFGFPDPFILHQPVLWLLSLFTQNIYLVYNLIILITFLSAGLAAYEVLVRLGCRNAIAVPIAWLFASLPNHLERYEHYSLAFYATTPLVILAALRCLRGERLTRWELVLMPLCGLLGAYYAFFGYIIILAAGLLGCLFRRSLYPLRPALQACTLIGLAFLLALWPALRGKTPDSAFLPPRQPSDLTRWALYLDRAILPAHSRNGHPLNKLARRYYANFPAPAEPDEAPYLGLLAVSAGLLLFLGQNPEQKDFPHLKVLATVIFLIGTVGGLGELFTLVVGPAIRCYNRISPYLAFVLLLALALKLESLRSSRRGWFAFGFLIFCAFIDQVTSVPRRNPDKWAAQVRSDREFVSQLEVGLADGARIWQLPYIAYPESPQMHQEGSYGEGRGYAVSHKIHWSWGALRGSAQERHQQALSRMPFDDQLELLGETGFVGVCVERRAYVDGGKEVEERLRQNGLRMQRESPDRFLAYYPLPKPVLLSQPQAQQIFEQRLIERTWNGGKIDFGLQGWGNLYLRSGWSDPEEGGLWTVQKSGYVKLPRPSGQKAEVGLQLLVYPYVGRPKIQRVQIFQEGRRIAWFQFRKGREHWIHFNASLPALLELRVERPTQPSYEYEADTRSLGLKIKRLEVVEPFAHPY